MDGFTTETNTDSFRFCFLNEMDQTGERATAKYTTRNVQSYTNDTKADKGAKRRFILTSARFVRAAPSQRLIGAVTRGHTPTVIGGICKNHPTSARQWKQPHWTRNDFTEPYNKIKFVSLNNYTKNSKCQSRNFK